MRIAKGDLTRAEVEGYAAIFDTPDLSGDILRRGAFTGLSQKFILTDPACVMMLYQHTAHEPIGRWQEVKEDAKGLFVRGTLFLDTIRGKDLFHLLRGQALDGLSIGFKPKRIRRLPDGCRELLSVDLWEVSVVTFPMAPKARITRVGDPGTPLPTNLLSYSAKRG